MRWVIFALGILAGCQSEKEGSDGGPVSIDLDKDYRFRHSSQKFSVEPQARCVVKPVCQEYCSEESNAIVLKDEAGYLVKVEVSTMPDEVMKDLYLQRSQDERQACLQSLFQRCVFPAIRVAIPSAEPSVQEGICLNDDVGYFAILYLPEGSNMENPVTHLRADAWRGYLLSFVGNHLVVISKQEVFYQLLPTMTKDLRPPKEKLLADLKGVLQGYRNEE